MIPSLEHRNLAADGSISVPCRHGGLYVMSRLLVVTYDLRPEATPKDYAHLASGLTGLGAKRLFLSSWAIRTSLTPAETAEAIGKYLDRTADKLLVVEVTGHAAINPAAPLDGIGL
jgi:hypothetical protein